MKENTKVNKYKIVDLIPEGNTTYSLNSLQKAIYDKISGNITEKQKFINSLCIVDKLISEKRVKLLKVDKVDSLDDEVLVVSDKDLDQSIKDYMLYRNRKDFISMVRGM